MSSSRRNNTRKNRYKKQTSTTLCKKCNRSYIRFQQHLDGSPACKSHYHSINEIKVNSSSLRRSSRNKNNLTESKDNECERKENNDELEHTIGDSGVSYTHDDDSSNIVTESNMSNMNKDQDLNLGLEFHLNSNCDNDYCPMNIDDDVPCEQFPDTILGNNASNNINPQLNRSYDSKSPYNFVNIADILYDSRETISFSPKQLISLKLFEILHQSQAPMSLYKEIQDFLDNSIPILMHLEKPYIISRTDLLNQMHKDIVFRGVNKKSPQIRTKRKLNNNPSNEPISNNISQTDNDNSTGSNEMNTNIPISNLHSNIIVPNIKDNSILSKLEQHSQLESQLYKSSLTFSMEPTKSNIELEDCHGIFPVTTFCLVSSIVGLLQNPILMSENNTIYHHSLYNDPSNNDFNPMNIYDDIHTSEWFKNTHSKVIGNRENVVGHAISQPAKVLCPIIFFIDGVAVDSYGRMSLEPVSYTLGIFKRNVRNLPIEWRVLGYIPNTQKAYHIRYQSNKKGGNLKKKHYQQILHHILQQMSALQKKGGILWKLPFYKQELDEVSGRNRRLIEYRKVNLIFETMVVIGDAPGNDQLCGRKKNYVPTKLMNTGTCRDCCVTYRDCDDYNYKCNFLTREFICNLDPKVLDQLSFYDVGMLAFDSLSFGHIPLGINSSTPPELLHVWYLGVVQFLIEYFLDRMTTKAKALLDKAVSNLALNYSRQSDRFMPKISTFTSGIDKCKLTGKEKGYQLFIIYIVMNSSMLKENIISMDYASQRRFKVHTITNSDGKKKRHKILLNKVIDTHDKYNKWLRIFEKMISIGEWMSASNIITKDVLKETIKVKLWSDIRGEDCATSIDTSESNQRSTRINNIRGIQPHNGNDSQEEEEEAIEVDEDNISNNIFFQSPDTVTDVANSNNVNIVIENDDDVCYGDEEIDQVVEPNDNELEDSMDTNNNLLVGNDSNTYHFGGRLNKKEFTISKVEYGIRLFMKEVRTVVSKEDRVRLKTVKFHQLLHFPHYIKMFGSPANIDGSRPEAIGKETAKYPGRHTQHRSDTMNFQAACRYFENTTIDLSFCIACSTGQFDNIRNNNWNTEYFTKSYVNKLKYKGQEQQTYLFETQNNVSTNEDRTNSINIMSSRNNQKVVPRGSIVFDYTYTRNNIRSNQRTRNLNVMLNEIDVRKNNMCRESSLTIPMSGYEKSYYKQIVKYFLEEKFLQKTTNAKGKIELLSCLKINNTIFRGSLAYYGDKQWFDWIDVEWVVSDEPIEYEVLPAKIIAFINGKRFMIDNGLLNSQAIDNRYPKSEYWAIIQSAKRADGANIHVSKMSTHYSLEDTLQCISIDSIKDTAFVVPDNVLDEKTARATSFISNLSKFDMLEKGTFISFKSTNQWANIFLEFEEGRLER